MESLADDARRRLLAYMVALEDRGREDYRAKLAGKIDEASPERWRTLAQCESELGLTDEAK